jgi:hypothetical protein
LLGKVASFDFQLKFTVDEWSMNDISSLLSRAGKTPLSVAICSFYEANSRVKSDFTSTWCRAVSMLDGKSFRNQSSTANYSTASKPAFKVRLISLAAIPSSITLPTHKLDALLTESFKPHNKIADFMATEKIRLS